MTATDDELESLRDEIDAIDDALHDLIMKRVQDMAAVKQAGVEKLGMVTRLPEE